MNQHQAILDARIENHKKEATFKLVTVGEKDSYVYIYMDTKMCDR